MYVLRLKKTDARTQRRGFHEENGRMSAEPVQPSPRIAMSPPGNLRFLFSGLWGSS
jgi:hypothetical protein